MSDAGIRPPNLRELIIENVRSEQVLSLINEKLDGISFPYDVGSLPKQIDQLTSIYSSLKSEYDKVSYMVEEGIFEVTLRTRSGATTFPVFDLDKGAEIGYAVRDVIEGQLKTTISRIQYCRKLFLEELTNPNPGNGLEQTALLLLYEQVLTRSVNDYQPALEQDSVQVLIDRLPLTQAENQVRASKAARRTARIRNMPIPEKKHADVSALRNQRYFHERKKRRNKR